MDGIVKLAATILPELVALERIRTTVPHIISRVVFSSLALVATAGALGCGIAALWIGLLPMIGPWAAPLACGGVLLLAAIIFIVLSRNHDRSRATSGTTAKAIENGDVTPLIRPLMRENKWLLITFAVVAGMVAASKDRPRKL